jgi:hypothetical protein
MFVMIICILNDLQDDAADAATYSNFLVLTSILPLIFELLLFLS